jgi:hypothetical protein
MFSFKELYQFATEENIVTKAESSYHPKAIEATTTKYNQEDDQRK